MCLSCPFKQSQRLRKAADFQQVFAKPSKSVDRYFTVLARPNAQMLARLGLAISKKRVKLSVMRNRIKRLVRESFRLHQHRLAGLDCVVLAREDAPITDNAILLHALAQHWTRVIKRCGKSSS